MNRPRNARDGQGSSSLGGGAVAQPFYPPAIRPATAAPRFPFYLPKLLSNNVAIIPERAFHEPLVLAPGPPRMAFFTGPEAVKAVLHSRASEFPKGALQNEVLRPLLGNAMISSEGEQWRWQRSATAPLFRHEEIVRYGSVMTEAAEAAVERWRRSRTRTPRFIHRDMLRAAFDVISRTMLTGGAPEFIEAIERGHARYFRAVNWWIAYRLLGLPRWIPRPGQRAMQSHEENLRGESFQAIVERDHATAEGGKDLLSRLANSTDPETGRGMSGKLLADNIAAFLVAGYDTTALTLTWTLYLISQSPEWATDA